eukprot:TRINITY_DN4308_c0_g1_i7.p1 TRINITY_DN4308_c0_g1~~TRINITY_DN4308_c0_g1_i7.p1  ORF type:complete len:847 (-),score=74.82 TRINITY_DN4308_c0_g1_i7:113-2653(-)
MFLIQETSFHNKFVLGNKSLLLQRKRKPTRFQFTRLLIVIARRKINSANPWGHRPYKSWSHDLRINIKNQYNLDVLLRYTELWSRYYKSGHAVQSLTQLLHLCSAEKLDMDIRCQRILRICYDILSDPEQYSYRHATWIVYTMNIITTINACKHGQIRKEENELGGEVAFVGLLSVLKEKVPQLGPGTVSLTIQMLAAWGIRDIAFIKILIRRVFEIHSLASDSRYSVLQCGRMMWGLATLDLLHTDLVDILLDDACYSADQESQLNDLAAIVWSCAKLRVLDTEYVNNICDKLVEFFPNVSNFGEVEQSVGQGSFTLMTSKQAEVWSGYDPFVDRRFKDHKSNEQSLAGMLVDLGSMLPATEMEEQIMSELKLNDSKQNLKQQISSRQRNVQIIGAQNHQKQIFTNQRLTNAKQSVITRSQQHQEDSDAGFSFDHKKCGEFQSSNDIVYNSQLVQQNLQNYNSKKQKMKNNGSAKNSIMKTHKKQQKKRRSQHNKQQLSESGSTKISLWKEVLQEFENYDKSNSSKENSIQKENTKISSQLQFQNSNQPMTHGAKRKTRIMENNISTINTHFSDKIQNNKNNNDNNNNNNNNSGIIQSNSHFFGYQYQALQSQEFFLPSWPPSGLVHPIQLGCVILMSLAYLNLVTKHEIVPILLRFINNSRSNDIHIIISTIWVATIFKSIDLVPNLIEQINQLQEMNRLIGRTKSFQIKCMAYELFLIGIFQLNDDMKVCQNAWICLQRRTFLKNQQFYALIEEDLESIDITNIVKNAIVDDVFVGLGFWCVDLLSVILLKQLDQNSCSFQSLRIIYKMKNFQIVEIDVDRWQPLYQQKLLNEIKKMQVSKHN